MAQIPATLSQPLPVGSFGRRASGWWGMLALIATEAALFAYLLFSYYYLASQATQGWLPELPHLRLALPNTFVLIASSVVVWWGERAIRQRDRRRLLIGLGAGFVLGIIFEIVQLMEWSSKPFSFNSSAYGSLYFTITGFHMLHVAAGIIMLAALFLWSSLGYMSAARHAAVSIGAIYWHFVDVVWLTVFSTFYIVPYLT